MSEYLERLAAREPVPGGGSAAALAGAMGASLLAMSARYSLGKGKAKAIEARFERLIAEADTARDVLTAVVSQDAQAYLNVVAARKSADKKALKLANREAAQVPRDMVKVCRKLLAGVPFLKKEANRYLVSDVIAAEIFLNAAINAAQAMVEANQ
ncbi:MAG: cyclodeaminase/cyclohydrolase family protein [Candidatus Omnitrophica bacterium]|nr:cyclodeaminase/cyclohydrolase family protein [Candidatus Omnitrophota bacterium]